MANEDQTESRFFPREVAALRAAGYEIQGHLAKRMEVDTKILSKAIEDGKVKVIEVGGNVRMVVVEEAEKYINRYKEERERAAMPARPAGGAVAVDMGPLVALIERLSAQIMVLTQQVEELVTRPMPTPMRATAKIESQDIVGALLSTGGRAALVGAVGTSLDASTSRQVIREAVMSALGSKEGQTAIRVALTAALNGHDPTRPG